MWSSFPHAHAHTYYTPRAQIVLADSRIVNANAQENADLYLVLKGGGAATASYGVYEHRRFLRLQVTDISKAP